MYPADLKYTKDHEWIRVEGDAGTVGITNFAQLQLGDVVYIDLPEVGASLKAGETFGTIESVKAVSELYAPVSGEVTAVNAELVSEPNNITKDPFGSSWIVKIKLPPGATLNHLLTVEQYEKQIAAEGH